MYKVKDPIHHVISLSEEEKSIIDNPAFQRLRRIKQLALAHYVYIGATHSRFEHSLGAMHISGIMARHLGLDVELARVIALLHDIGHISFSHLAEDVLMRLGDKSHDEKAKDVIKEYFPDVYSKYGEKLFSSPEAMLWKFSLGSDRIDYLKRDAYYTGVAYGVLEDDILIERLFYVNGKLAIRESALEAVESFFISRFMMFFAVYFHKTVRIADAMLAKALSIALLKEELSREELFWDGDDVILYKLLSTSARDLARAILRRQLYKKVCFLKPTRESMAIAEEMEKQGCIYHAISRVEKPYDIFIGDELKPITDISPLVAGLKAAEESKRNILVACPKDKLREAKALLQRLSKA